MIANCASNGFVTASLTVRQLVDHIQYSGNIWQVISFTIALILAFSELYTYLEDCLELSCNHCLIVKMEDVTIRFEPRFQLIRGYRAYRVIWMSTKLAGRLQKTHTRWHATVVDSSIYVVATHHTTLPTILTFSLDTL